MVRDGSMSLSGGMLIFGFDLLDFIFIFCFHFISIVYLYAYMYFVYDFFNNNNNRPNIAVKSDSLYTCYGPTCKRLILFSMLYCAFATVVFMLLRFFLLMIKDLYIFGTSEAIIFKFST